jgi:hypothetical protein
MLFGGRNRLQHGFFIQETILNKALRQPLEEHSLGAKGRCSRFGHSI